MNFTRNHTVRPCPILGVTPTLDVTSTNMGRNMITDMHTAPVVVACLRKRRGRPVSRAWLWEQLWGSCKSQNTRDLDNILADLQSQGLVVVWKKGSVTFVKPTRLML